MHFKISTIFPWATHWNCGGVVAPCPFLTTVGETVLASLIALSVCGLLPSLLETLPSTLMGQQGSLAHGVGALPIKSPVWETGTSRQDAVALGHWVLYSVLSCQSAMGVFSVSVSIRQAPPSCQQPSMQPVQTQAISIHMPCEWFCCFSWCWSSCPSLMTWCCPACSEPSDLVLAATP